MLNSMSCSILKSFCFQISFLITLLSIFTGCNKFTDNKTVGNSLARKHEIHTDSFSYEISIYDAKGRLSRYVLTSLKPLTQLDSSNFMEESLKDEQGNKNP